MLPKIKNKFAILSFLIISFYVGANIARAETKIAIIDAQKVIENSVAYQGISKEVEKKAEIYKANANRLQEKLQKKYQELEAQKSVLSNDVFNSKSEDLLKEAEISQKSTHMERITLDKAYSQAVGVLENKLLEIVQKKAQEKNINVVFAKSNTLYAESNLEITDEVLNELNSSLSEVKVDFSTQTKSIENKQANTSKSKK